MTDRDPPVLAINSTVRLGWLDRLRVLLHGEVRVESRVAGVDEGTPYHIETDATVPPLFGSTPAVGCEIEDGGACSCDECRAACTDTTAGWFAPGEVEGVAALLGVTLERLFRERLAVDWWEADSGPPTFLLAPAQVGQVAGEMRPWDMAGECVFYEGDRCGIHGAKPAECRAFRHGDTREVTHERRRALAARWAGHQGQIRNLLGEEPGAAGPPGWAKVMGRS